MTVTVVFFLIVLIADQVTKSAVTSRLPEGAATAATLYGVRFRHVVNRRSPWKSRVALGWMTPALLLFTTVASAVSVFMESPLMYAGLGALVGGAAGNLADGFQRNAVTDFIDLRVWPVFNVADAAIVAGAAAMLWELTRFSLNA